MVSDSVSIVVQIISLITGLFSTYIIFDFMSKFGRKLYYKKYLYVLAYIIFTLLLCLVVGTSNFIFTIAGTIVIGHFLYNDDKIYILYYSLYIIFYLSIQILSTIIIQLIFYKLNVSFYDANVYVATLSIIVRFINLSSSRLFIILHRKRRIEKISTIQYLNFLVLPLFSVFYIITLLNYVQMYMNTGDIILLAVNFVAIILLNLFITSIFESISKNNQLRNELMLYEEQAKLNYEYYTNLENKYMDSRKVMHDMKNHLQIIEDLYGMEEKEKAEKYTKDMYTMLENFSQKYYTSNKVLNVILNDKIQKAENMDIKVDCKIGDISLDFIKDIDLTTIFSNLLDNAITSAKGGTADKSIYIKIDKFNEFIVMNMSNTMDKAPIVEEGRIHSRKENHRGIGLSNIEMTVKRYEGTMRVDHGHGSFKVNIVIPIIN